MCVCVCVQCGVARGYKAVAVESPVGAHSLSSREQDGYGFTAKSPGAVLDDESLPAL